MNLVTEETPKVELIDFNELAQKEAWAFDIANYAGGSRTRGLTVYGCECGAHCFALAWDDAMERWFSHQVSPIRSILEEKGYKPDKPSPSPHVVLIDHEDAALLKERRWRALPTKKGHRAKFFLQSGRRAVPAQRMIFPSAECIEIVNGNGLDLRRCNLRRTSLRALLRERNNRQGWKAKKGPRKAVVGKAA